MNRVTISILVLCNLLLGILIYIYLQGWIIITVPGQLWPLPTGQNTTAGIKKRVNLSYWHHDKWYVETQELMCPIAKEQHIYCIIQNWFTLLEQEHIMQHVSLQSVLLAANESDVYISCNRSPFKSEQPTFEHLMWMEGLLKTLRENISGINTVQLLVQHQPLQDTLLDVSCPWPITGFLK